VKIDQTFELGKHDLLSNTFGHQHTLEYHQKGNLSLPEENGSITRTIG